MEDLGKIFTMALKCSLKGKPYGYKSKLAREVGISSSLLGDMISGRTYGSEEKRRAIAKHFSYSYDSFLNVGRIEMGIAPQKDAPTVPGGETVTISRDEYEALKAAVAKLETEKDDYPDKNLLDALSKGHDNIQELLVAQIDEHAGIKAVLSEQLKEHGDIKALLAKQVKGTEDQAEKMREAIAGAIAEAAKHVRDEKYERMLTDRNNYIFKLRAELEQVQTTVAGDIVTVKEGVFRLVGDKPGPDGPGEPH